jgi:hypothetical protein
MIKAHWPMAPERNLLQTEYAGSRGCDLSGKQLAAGCKIGTVDHLLQLVVRMTQGKHSGLTRPADRGAYWAVDVRT